MIEIYGNEGCGYCVKAKDICESNQLKYTYKSIQDPDVFIELQEKVPNVRTVPQVFWHGKLIGGYNELASEIENTRNFGQEKI